MGGGVRDQHNTTGIGPAKLCEAAGAADRLEMLATVDRFLVKYYGKRCPSLSGGCWNCMAWAARDMLSATIAE